MGRSTPALVQPTVSECPQPIPPQADPYDEVKQRYNVLHPPVSQTNFPNVRFWYQSSFVSLADRSQTKGITDLTTRPADLSRYKGMSFIEDQHGKSARFASLLAAFSTKLRIYERRQCQRGSRTKRTASVSFVTIYISTSPTSSSVLVIGKPSKSPSTFIQTGIEPTSRGILNRQSKKMSTPPSHRHSLCRSWAV